MEDKILSEWDEVVERTYIELNSTLRDLLEMGEARQDILTEVFEAFDQYMEETMGKN